MMRQIYEFVRRVKEAECIVVGGASGLSAADGGDFYYGDTPSFRKYFGKYAEKYGFKGAFDGMYSVGAIAGRNLKEQNGCRCP